MHNIDRLKKWMAILVLLIIGLMVIGLIICTMFRLTKYILPIMFGIIFISILSYIFLWFAKMHSK